jgi:hypothetical protein
MRFRKKPVVVDAVQWRGDNYEEIVAFVGAKIRSNPLRRQVVIQTLEGDHVASAGDWIIRGISGEFYPCKPEIFRETYDPVLS